MANANVDAEKLVFAADMVCFFMKKHYPGFEFELEPDIASVVDSFRPHVRHHFTENLIKIINDIDDTQGFIVHRDFSEMQRNKGEIDLSTLMEYFDSFKNANLAERFSVGNFLLFCARVSLISCFFFVSGRKSDLNYMIDIIKDSFPKDEDECRLLWNDIDKAAENYGRNSSGDSTPAILEREPSEPVNRIPNETEDSSKNNIQENPTSSLFGREARESPDAISNETEGRNRGYLQNGVFDDERREIADVISSGTEDSCSSSSTTNTESDNSANTQNMSSASSDESLNRLIMKLNRMVAPAAAANPVPHCRPLAAAPFASAEAPSASAAATPSASAAANPSASAAANPSASAAANPSASAAANPSASAAATPSASAAANPSVPALSASTDATAPANGTAAPSAAAPAVDFPSVAAAALFDAVVASTAGASNTGSVKYDESQKSDTTTATVSNTGSVKYDESQKSDTTTATVSNTGSVKYDESQQSDTTTATVSNTESVKSVKSQESPTVVVASSTETVKYVKSEKSATQAVSAENLESNIQNPSVSSSTSNRCPKIEIDFKTKFENAFMEVQAESSQKSPLKSPSKSCLGKRPSPRKTVSEDTGGDDSETEIKKPKLGSPESKE